MAKKRKQYPIDQELLDRHCPICGIGIKAGDPLHHCDSQWLENMEADRKDYERKVEEGVIEAPRSYSDRLGEASPLLDPDIYYEADDETEPEF